MTHEHAGHATWLGLLGAVLAGAIVAAVFVGGASGQTSGTAPVNHCAPQIEGSLVVGKTLTATNGCWDGSPTSFTYSWLRCSQSGTNCTPIAGAMTQTYTLTTSDIGHTIVALVTAKNAAGSTGREGVAVADRGARMVATARRHRGGDSCRSRRAVPPPARGTLDAGGGRVAHRRLSVRVGVGARRGR